MSHYLSGLCKNHQCLYSDSKIMVTPLLILTNYHFTVVLFNHKTYTIMSGLSLYCKICLGGFLCQTHKLQTNLIALRHLLSISMNNMHARNAAWKSDNSSFEEIFNLISDSMFIKSKVETKNFKVFF